MKVFCLSNELAYKSYKQGIYPSHFLYGAIEIEKAGFDLIVKAGKSNNKFLRYFDMARVIIQENPDVLFLPFITKDVFLIILLKKLGLFKKPIIGWFHRSLKTSNILGRFLFKCYYKEFDKIFFLSPLSLKESIDSGILCTKNTAIVSWGGDLTFYKNLQQNDEDKAYKYFVSTGKENRDFSTLIDAFGSNRNAKLKIFTNYSHAGRSYNYLDVLADKCSNINISIIKNDKKSFELLAKATAKSFCVTIPLIKSEVNYCVGLSSIVEALALGKPIIVTNNPYHPIDVEKEKIGLKVDNSIESWKDAINYFNDNPEIAEAMGDRARKLAEKKYNIELSSKEIIRYLITKERK